MKLLRILFISIFFTSVFNSCQAQQDFNKELWIKNPDISIEDNPRLEMVDDLINSYLKKGMDKKMVVNLLGQPNSDTIGVILPKGLKLPDSLKINYNIKQSDSIKLEITKKAAQWYNDNYKNAKVMYYILGWSLIDPIFLNIHIDNENKVVDFWTKEY